MENIVETSFLLRGFGGGFSDKIFFSKTIFCDRSSLVDRRPSSLFVLRPIAPHQELRQIIRPLSTFDLHLSSCYDWSHHSIKMSPSSRHLPVITAFAAVSFYLIHKYQRHSEEEDNFIVNHVLPSLKTRRQRRYYANERRARNRKLWSEFQAELSDRQFRRSLKDYALQLWT